MGDPRRKINVSRTWGVSRNLTAKVRDAMRKQSDDEWLESVRIEIARRMAEIAAMFLPGAKVTVMVRRPGVDDADVCISDDEFPDMIAMLHRCQAREIANAE